MTKFFVRIHGAARVVTQINRTRLGSFQVMFSTTQDPKIIAMMDAEALRLNGLPRSEVSARELLVQVSPDRSRPATKKEIEEAIGFKSQGGGR